MLVCGGHALARGCISHGRSFSSQRSQFESGVLEMSAFLRKPVIAYFITRALLARVAALARAPLCCESACRKLM